MGVIAIRQAFDEVCDARTPGGGFDLFHRRVGLAEGDVVGGGVVVDEGVLLHEGNAVPQTVEPRAIERRIVQSDRAGRRVPEPHEQPQHGGLAHAAGSDDADLLAPADGHVGAIQHQAGVPLVAEGHVLKANVSHGVQGDGIRGLGDGGRLVFDFKQAFRRSEGLQQARHHRDQRLSGGEGGGDDEGEYDHRRQVPGLRQRKPRRHEHDQYPRHIDEEVGHRLHELLVQGHAVGGPVDLAALIPQHLKPFRADAEDLDVLQAVDALEDQRFHFAQLPAIPRAHGAARPHRHQRHDDGYDDVHRKQRQCQLPADGRRVDERQQRQQYHREHGTDGVGKKLLNGVDVRDGDGDDVTPLPIHQASGGELPQLVEEAGTHVRQQRIGRHVGCDALQVAHARDGDRAQGKHRAPQPGAAAHQARIAEDQAGACAHQGHAGHVAHDAAKGRPGDIFSLGRGDAHEPPRQLPQGVFESPLHAVALLPKPASSRSCSSTNRRYLPPWAISSSWLPRSATLPSSIR